MSKDIEIVEGANSLSWDAFMSLWQEHASDELGQRLDDIDLDDLTTLIYTSGTTGQPKGVMLTYSNIAAQLEGHDRRLGLTPKDVSLCFLPLSHVFERAWTFCVLYKGPVNVYLKATIQVPKPLGDNSPTVL